MTTARPEPAADDSVGRLMSRISEDLSVLVRDELRLAQVETTTKAKKLGLGLGLFGGAGLFAVFGVGVLVAAAVLGLATVLHAWLAALIVGAALLAVAGVAALLGRKDVAAATPPVPVEAVDGLRTDVRTLQEGMHR